MPEPHSSSLSGSSSARQLPLRALGCGVLLLIPGCIGLLAWLLLRTGPLIERLVSEANALEGAPHPRPAHVTPATAGTFAQAVEPLLREARELPEPEPDTVPRPQEDDEAASEVWSRAFEALRTKCLTVASGKAPIDTLPPPCRKALDDGRDLMRRILAATHAEIGGLPAGAGSLSRPSFSLQPTGMRMLERAVELAALETLLLRAEGHHEKAVDTCLDALAVCRELSLGGGLHGSQLSASSLDVVYRPCAMALDAASVERKRLALAQLARLWEGWAPSSAILREESVFHQLETFGPDFFPLEALPRLPLAGRKLVASSGGWTFFTSRIGHPWLRRYVWRRNAAMFDAMVAVADLPPDERRRAFARIDSDHALLAGYPCSVNAGKYHHDLEQLESRRRQEVALTTLVEVDLARTEKGRWPDALSPSAEKSWSLEVVSEREARLIPRDAESANPVLVLTADQIP